MAKIKTKIKKPKFGHMNRQLAEHEIKQELKQLLAEGIRDGHRYILQETRTQRVWKNTWMEQHLHHATGRHRTGNMNAAFGRGSKARITDSKSTIGFGWDQDEFDSTYFKYQEEGFTHKYAGPVPGMEVRAYLASKHGPRAREIVINALIRYAGGTDLVNRGLR